MIESLEEDHLNRICFERGIQFDDETNLKQRQNDLKLWMSVSNLRNVPDTLLIYSRIITMVEEIYDISESDDEYEIFRSNESEVYFTEKFRIFEKVFGIDDIKTHYEEMAEKLKVAKKEKLFDPSENKFIFSKEELDKHHMALEEFKTRHNALSESIEDTYRVGNKIMDLLEKQMIINAHFRGQYSELYEA